MIFCFNEELEMRNEERRQDLIGIRAKVVLLVPIREIREDFNDNSYFLIS